ncbi:translation initiation factor IF-2-like [Portunus trituberculatus]|uniref:translation initiation factor IF-2-like n=1 Tax=Portunus trituberculatus TaxID=210409 RepID=UPI001E1CCA07|nr:translation initiation factor IF-2-like [Portunus trituberculatus]
MPPCHRAATPGLCTLDLLTLYKTRGGARRGARQGVRGSALRRGAGSARGSGLPQSHVVQLVPAPRAAHLTRSPPPTTGPRRTGGRARCLRCGRARSGASVTLVPIALKQTRGIFPPRPPAGPHTSAAPRPNPPRSARPRLPAARSGGGGGGGGALGVRENHVFLLGSPHTPVSPPPPRAAGGTLPAVLRRPPAAPGGGHGRVRSCSISKLCHLRACWRPAAAATLVSVVRGTALPAHRLLVSLAPGPRPGVPRRAAPPLSPPLEWGGGPSPAAQNNSSNIV